MANCCATSSAFARHRSNTSLSTDSRRRMRRHLRTRERSGHDLQVTHDLPAAGFPDRHDQARLLWRRWVDFYRFSLGSIG
jgi:hypothetical protein